MHVMTVRSCFAMHCCSWRLYMPQLAFGGITILQANMEAAGAAGVWQLMKGTLMATGCVAPGGVTCRRGWVKQLLAADGGAAQRACRLVARNDALDAGPA
jgi:hypothetical protein